MNELVLNSGGRRLYNEDLVDIQSHILANQVTFLSETPFILSGLEYTLVTGTTYDISDAYLWLGNKVRYYSGASGVDLSTPFYINVLDVNESRLYDDNVTRVSNIDYKTELSTTNLGGSSSIRIDQPSSVRRYYTNVLGDKYLQLNTSNTQEVLGAISLKANLTSDSLISTSGNMSAANLDVIGGEINAKDGIFTGGLEADTLNILGMADIASDLDVGGRLTAPVYRVSGQASDTIDSDGNISSNRVDQDSIQSNSVGNDELIANSVTQDKIDENAVGTSELAPNAVQNDNLGIQVVETDNIANLNVTGDKIANGTITATKMGTASVNSNGLADNSVSSSKIQDDAVRVDHIATGAVDTEQIFNGAVDNNKLADNAVRTNHILDGAVSLNKLGTGVVRYYQSSQTSSFTLFNNGDRQTFNVSHSIGNTNYRVILTMNSDSFVDVPPAISITSKTSSGFTIAAHNVSNSSTGGTIEYMVIGTV